MRYSSEKEYEGNESPRASLPPVRLLKQQTTLKTEIDENGFSIERKSELNTSLQTPNLKDVQPSRQPSTVTLTLIDEASSNKDDSESEEIHKVIFDSQQASVDRNQSKTLRQSEDPYQFARLNSLSNQQPKPKRRVMSQDNSD